MDCIPPGSRLWDLPGNNTGVGHHFLLQGNYLFRLRGVFIATLRLSLVAVYRLLIAVASLVTEHRL